MKPLSSTPYRQHAPIAVDDKRTRWIPTRTGAMRYVKWYFQYFKRPASGLLKLLVRNKLDHIKNQHSFVSFAGMPKASMSHHQFMLTRLRTRNMRMQYWTGKKHGLVKYPM